MPHASELLLDALQQPPPENVRFGCFHAPASRCNRVLQLSSAASQSSTAFYIKGRGGPVQPDDHFVTVRVCGIVLFCREIQLMLRVY